MTASGNSESRLDPGSPLSETSNAGGRLHAIYDVGRRLLDARDPGDVIQTIESALVAQLRPDHACILTLRADGSLQPLAAHGLDLSASADSWPLSHTALTRVRETGMAILAEYAERDARFQEAGSVHQLRIRSVICVPLGPRPLRGFVYLDNRGRARRFQKTDLEFVSAVALYASRVLEHADQLARASQALALSDERRSVLQEELLRHEIVGRSPKLISAYDALRRFAAAGAAVLLRGETGTGKELFARAYAANSPRAGRAWVPVPIPALAPTLVESELFGHVRGAFTEASRDKKGRLELADGGVLFLDEIGDVEPGLQTKLLRFLDSGELHRVGDTQLRRVDALVVAATSSNLEGLVAAGRFRGDLLARLGQTVTLPPLRDRPDDVPLLVVHFAKIFARGGRPKEFSALALEALAGYSWPFNVRELRQVVERAVCLVDRETVRPEDLSEYVRRAAPVSTVSEQPAPVDASPGSLREIIERAEKQHILKVLEFTGGNKRRAIELLKISSETFYRRLEEYGLRPRE